MKRLVLVFCFVAAGCSTMRSTTNVDPSVDFSTFETFTWIDPHPLIVAETEEPLAPAAEQHLMDSTQTALEQRGLRFVDHPDQADLAVAFTITTRQRVHTTELPTTNFSQPWSRRWHSDVGVTSTTTHAQLGIELFEVATARSVWQSNASRLVTSDMRADPKAALENAVHTILHRFPPK